MSGHPDLLRRSPRRLDPQAKCGLPICGEGGTISVCGGVLAVKDWHPDGTRGSLRYELFCTKCQTCDLNGYATQVEVMDEGLVYFDAKVTK